jgi:hypothetical protein
LHQHMHSFIAPLFNHLLRQQPRDYTWVAYVCSQKPKIDSLEISVLELSGNIFPWPIRIMAKISSTRCASYLSYFLIPSSWNSSCSIFSYTRLFELRFNSRFWEDSSRPLSKRLSFWVRV